MKKAFLLFVLLISAATMGWGQTTVSYTGMGTIICPASPTATISPSVPGLTFSQITRGSGVTCATANSGISGSGFNVSLANAISGNKWYVFSVSSDATVSFTVSSLSIVSQVSSATGSPNVSVQYKIGSSGSLNEIGSFTPTTSSVAYTFNPSSAISVSASQTIYIYVIPNNLSASTTTCRVNNNTSISVTTSLVGSNTITTGTVSFPPFCITSSSTASGTVAYTSTGTYSSATFTAYLSDANGDFTSPTNIGTTSVTGTNPSGSIDITIPADKTSGTGYKIRIDCNNPAVTGSTSAAFEIVNGANNVSGQSASTQSGQSVISWTNPTGCYDEIMIVGKAGSAVTASPSGDGSDYPLPNLTFGSGTGFDGGYVLYKGSTSGQTVTNLTNGTTYYFTFFTRRGSDWSSGVTSSVTPAQSSSATDYFRSKQTGNWNATSTWESSSDDITYYGATMTPDNNANTITIQTGHTVTVTANVTVDQLVVNGNLTVNSGVILSTNNGTGDEITLNGTFLHLGTVPNPINGIGIINNGGTYIHNTTSSASRMADFFLTKDVNSNWIYRGSSSLTPAVSLGGKSYGNLSFESTSGTLTVDFTGTAGFTVNGNFILGSNVTFNITNTAVNNFKGNYTINGIISYSTGTQNFAFSGTSQQTISGSGTVSFETMTVESGASISLSNSISVLSGFTTTVNGLIDFGTSSISGNGSFVLALGGTLRTANSSGLDGSITVNGTKTLNTAANYIFNGAGTQVTGALLPSTVQSLTLAGTSDLSVSNSGLLTVSGGMTIGSGTKFTIGSAQSLTVGGTLTNNGNASSLVIKSDATGTGSLITSSSPLATVERYLTNYTTTTDHKYHMISSPVTLQAIRPMFVANTPSLYDDFYKYDETATSNPWINTKDGDGNWNTAFESEFVVGRGYLVSYKDIPVSPRSFSGTLNSYSSGSPLVITCTYTEAGGKGWNLIGNPFSSALDWNLVTPSLGSGMDNALYYYDASTENYLYYIDINGGIGTGSRYIPAMQGFMVHAKSSGTHTVTLNDGMRAHSSQNFYKSAESLPGSLSLTVSSGGYEDAAFVYFHEGATTAFDGSYDAYKLSSYNTEVPAIYTISSDNKNVAINGLPELTEDLQIPVWFKAGKVGTYTLNADIANMPATVFLKDLETGTDKNLRVNPEYTFTAGDLEASGRFLLHFSALGVDNGGNADGLNIYTSGNGIFITSGGNVPVSGDIFVYNLVGQQILHQRMAEGSLSKIAVNGPSGYYLVKVVTGQKSFTGKVFIR